MITTPLCLWAALGLAATVQERVLVKADTLAVSAGGTWLERGDLLSSPGVSLGMTYFWDETFGIDYLEGAYYFTRERRTARELSEATGWRQSRERPRYSVASGARYAFGYAKLLLEGTGTVIHFSPELAAHGGALFTDAGARPMADVALGVRARVEDWLVLLLEYRLTGSAEPEGLVLGRRPTLAVGLVF